MSIAIKRAYEKPSPGDGFRVLVDRMWPRGVSKDKAAIDLWLKEIAPGTELRKWFGHDPAKWPAFKKRYFRELNGRPEAVGQLRQTAKRQTVTLVYAAKDPDFNNAVALKEYLQTRFK